MPAGLAERSPQSAYRQQACTEAEQKSPDNSPIEMAVNDARRMARRRLEAGGVAALAPKRVEPNAKPADFIVPRDIDADEFAKAIEAKLRERGSPVPDADSPALLKRKAGEMYGGAK